MHRKLLALFLSISLLGFPLQSYPTGLAAADTAFDLQPWATGEIALDAIASTDILNATESGLLVSIAIIVPNTITDASTVTLDITVDGGTTRSLSVYNVSTGWDPAGLGAFRSFSGSGNAANNTAILVLNIRYLTSIQVALNVTDVAGAGDLLRVNVLRGIEL